MVSQLYGEKDALVTVSKDFQEFSTFLQRFETVFTQSSNNNSKVVERSSQQNNLAHPFTTLEERSQEVPSNSRQSLNQKPYESLSHEHRE